ncbi:MAG: HD domain-containing protein [bacterium]|nr:HD domain-containing protein [bacterium]
MNVYLILAILAVAVLALGGSLLYILIFLGRLGKATDSEDRSGSPIAYPTTFFPILSRIAERYAQSEKSLSEQKGLESFQTRVTTFEKQEIAHLLEKEELSRELVKQLEETRQANLTVSTLNINLETMNVSLNEAINRLSALNQISRMMGMEHDKKQIYSMAVSLPAELLQAEIGHLLLLDAERGELVVEYSQGMPERRVSGKRSVPLGQGLAGWVAANRKPLLVEDFSSQDTFSPVSSIGYERKTAISAPVMISDELIGVISLINRRNRMPFSEGEKTLLATIASETAMAIHNALLLEKIQKSYFSMVQSLIVAVESKDMYTKGHSERVTQYSLLIAEQMGLTMDQLEVVQQASVLHDIGKITIDLSILNKPTTLNSEEYDKIMDHPLTGYRILEPIDFDDKIKQCVLQHHERLDGKGYPNGMREEEIFLESRILAAADAFDAMTTKRPYRDPMNISEALREMEKHTGTQFDPDVVAVLKKIVNAMTSSGVSTMIV